MVKPTVNVEEIVIELPPGAVAPDDEPRISSYESPSDVPGLSDEEREIAAATMDPTAAQLARAARRPDISWLENAVVTVDGAVVPLFNVGDRIVIERYCHSLSGSPWLDTQTYVVVSIDDDSGDVRLWNPDLKQHAASNFMTAIARGDVMKLAPTKGNIGKKKRGRPRKHPLGSPAAAQPPAGEKRGRGRPKGSKNRPKEVIKAEKEMRKATAAKRGRKAKG